MNNCSLWTGVMKNTDMHFLYSVTISIITWNSNTILDAQGLASRIEDRGLQINNNQIGYRFLENYNFGNSCAILVEGVKPSTDLDVLILFFDVDRMTGGVPVVPDRCVALPEQNKAVICFENPTGKGLNVPYNDDLNWGMFWFDWCSFEII